MRVFGCVDTKNNPGTNTLDFLVIIGKNRLFSEFDLENLKCPATWSSQEEENPVSAESSNLMNYIYLRYVGVPFKLGQLANCPSCALPIQNPLSMNSGKDNVSGEIGEIGS